MMEMNKIQIKEIGMSIKNVGMAQFKTKSENSK